MTTTQHRPGSGVSDGARYPGEAASTGAEVEGQTGTSRAWVIVAVREIVVRVTNRAFLISTLLTLVFIAGFAAFSAWQAARTTTYTVAVSTADGTRLVERAAAEAKSASDNVVITPKTLAGETAARAAVDNGEIDAWLHQTASGWIITSGDEVGLSLLAPVETAVRDAALERNARAAGTTVQALERAPP